MPHTKSFHLFTFLTGASGTLLFFYQAGIPEISLWKEIVLLSIFTILLYLGEIRLPGGSYLSFISIGLLSSLFIYGLSVANWVVFMTILFSLFKRKGEYIKVFFNFGVFIIMLNATYYTYRFLAGHDFPVRFDEYIPLLSSILVYSFVNILFIFFFHVLSGKQTVQQVYRQIVSNLSNFFVTIVPALLFAVVLKYQPVLGSISLLIIVGLINRNFSKYYTLFNKYEKVSVMASTDEVTGLKNHRYFQEKLSLLLGNAGKEEKVLSVIFIDIDYFKHYNDTFGHPSGDKLLHQLARILKENFRSTDVVARYGGEEFVVIAWDADETAAFNMSERARSQVEAYPFFGADKQPQGKLTISCGIATFPSHTRDKEKLIELADQALYQAKSQGKNKVCIYGQPPPGHQSAL
ncbi:MAG: GGDEF domain-containing protein [Bacillaceae bacterium]|nr:GGDEF domain-containing protein [Bacillaceae bacterium]